jgi:hypothetical protein
MSIEGFIGGIMMLITSVSSGNIDSKTVYNGAVLVDKVITKNKQGTWNDSIHEESYQIIKDSIRKIGR